MPTLNAEQALIFLVALCVLFCAAKLFGELARKLKQPAVIGELFAGILLGPTILGAVAPGLFQALFVHSAPSSIALDGFLLISVILLLFTVGIEIELDSIAKQGKAVAWIGALGLIIPLVLGFIFGWFVFPLLVIEMSRLLFSLFIGAALSISALPVIARVLMDLQVLKTPSGNLIIAIATINDIVGWILFTVVLALSGKSSGHVSITVTILATLALTILSATWLRRFMAWALDRIQAWTHSKGAVLGFTLVLALAASILTEYLGVHAVFGAFLIGLAASSAPAFSEDLKHTVNQFVGQVMAPMFFAAAGLKVNFLASLNLPLVIGIILVAYLGKFLASYIGGRLAHLSKDTILATAYGIAARGGMGIILAVIARNAGLIDDQIFTALVLMALVTSMSAGLVKKHISQT